ncbi:MAG: hypothetical protein MMC23_002275 [Stictis urceolatum]|nr:hypothetical protein [Stictis urceolata]
MPAGHQDKAGGKFPPPPILRSTQERQGARSNFRTFAQGEFRKNATVDRKDFSTVEYLVRRGQRQLELYSEPGIKNIVR